MMSEKYIHTPEFHNLDAPKEIVPFLIEKFHPQSVLDIGCGTGTFLKMFEENNITDIMGIDGSWVKKDQLMISSQNFLVRNLEQKIEFEKKYDLVLCLEVAEHLSEEAADILINNLTNAGDIIIFSAAVKNQGGQNHLNEQPFDYWIEKFKKKEFFFYDIFRKKFWNNEKVNWWYKQNMFLVIHESIKDSFKSFDLVGAENIQEYIHPDLLQLKENELKTAKNKLRNINHGKFSAKFYFSFLKKKISVKLFKNLTKKFL